jgi:hypothetical protein
MTPTPKVKLQSDWLFEKMGADIPKEDCIRIAKENRLNEIRAYMNIFQGKLYKNINDISEEELTEITLAVKFFCRIEEINLL